MSVEFSDNRSSSPFDAARRLGWRSHLAALQGYPRAKRYLIEQGRTAAEVEAMPVAQVILLYTVQIYDELSDEQFKWFFLPGGGGAKGWNGPNGVWARQFAPERSFRSLLLLPASAAAKNAETRCEWTVAILRIFEAMRLYAAAHDGRWPDRLSDITEVPIPMNPFDGESFIYHREGNKADLDVEGPKTWPGDTKSPDAESEIDDNPWVGKGRPQ